MASIIRNVKATSKIMNPLVKHLGHPEVQVLFSQNPDGTQNLEMPSLTQEEVDVLWASFNVTQALLDGNRIIKIKEVKEYGLSLITSKLPYVTSFDTLGLLVDLWPMLDETQAPIAMLEAKTIYQYAKSKILQAQNATQEQLDAYDPTTDIGWTS